jgi:hypothetical protein
MATLFDYLDAYVYAYHAAGELSPPAEASVPGAEAVGHGHDSIVGLETVFGHLGGEHQQPSSDAASADDHAGLGDGLVDHHPGPGESPADAWLSGNEWSGEAEIGGTALTGGTVDPSGEGNDVFAVDGEVLDLPG